MSPVNYNCHSCNGKGFVWVPDIHNLERASRIIKRQCTRCNGSGVLPEDETLADAFKPSPEEQAKLQAKRDALIAEMTTPVNHAVEPLPDVPQPELPDFKSEQEYNDFFGYPPVSIPDYSYQTLERYQNRGGTVLNDEIGLDGAKAVEAALDEYDQDGHLYIVLAHQQNTDMHKMTPTFVVYEGVPYRLEAVLGLGSDDILAVEAEAQRGDNEFDDFVELVDSESPTVGDENGSE